jgi:hypothetical protein
MSTPKAPVHLIKLSSIPPAALYARFAGVIDEKLKDERLSAKEAGSLREYQYYANNFLRPFVDDIRIAGLDHAGTTKAYVSSLMAFLVFCGELKAGQEAQAIKIKELDRQKAELASFANQMKAMALHKVLDPIVIDARRSSKKRVAGAKMIRPDIVNRLRTLVNEYPPCLDEGVLDDLRAMLKSGGPSISAINAIIKNSKAKGFVPE